MRKVFLAVLTVLSLALASCSMSVQPVQQPEQQHQVKFEAVTDWGEPFITNGSRKPMDLQSIG